MKVTVDKDVCVGCGMCVDMCSEVFKFNEDYKSEVVSEANSSNCDKIKECESICPVGAIKLDS